MITPEQRQQASDALHEAIQKYVQDIGGLDLRADGTLGDWMLVASSVFVDERDSTPNCDYFVAFKGGSMLQHVAYGLLKKGQQLLESGQLEEDE